MARTLNPENVESAAPPPRNSEARRLVLKAYYRDRALLEDNRANVSAEIATLNKRVKADLDMKISDLSTGYRMSLLDDDGRREMLETIRETFAALGLSDQLNWLNGDAGFAAAAQDDAAIEEAFGQGAIAAANGLKLTEAFVQWTDSPGASKRQKKAFEDGWSERAAAGAVFAAPKRGPGRPPKAQRRAELNEAMNAAPSATEEERAPSVINTTEIEAPTTTEAAYHFGEKCKNQGMSLMVSLTISKIPADNVELRESLEAGWEDANEAALAAADREPVQEFEQQEY